MLGSLSVGDVVSNAVLIIGGAFALSQYWHSQKVKAAEFLLTLEKEYAPHMKVLLRVEYDETYNNILRIPITKQIVAPAMRLNREESDVIDELESALRFFFTSRAIMELRVDIGYIDRMNAYYLRKLRSRPEIAKYMEMYWPALYFWSELIARPWFRRWPIYCSQIRARFKNYAYGSDALARRGVKPFSGSALSEYRESPETEPSNVIM
ncbi:MAG: hypothetical protein IPH13_10120 [Planctomycetes bacterium]|nr:hypothetical protein [Planctomycetota bacterium]